MSLYTQQIKLDFDDVLIRPKRSTIDSRSIPVLVSETLERVLHIQTNGIIAANMDGVGTLRVAAAMKRNGGMTAITKHHDSDELLEHFSCDDSSHSFYSMGMSDGELEKLKRFTSIVTPLNTPLKICIDVANGYMSKFGDFVATVKKYAPEAIVMAGNIVDIYGVQNLKFADIVKVGIGPGSGCLTRSQTGVGYPQLSAVYDINQVIHLEHSRPLICSDGGCVTPGDIAKAMVAGANTVMLGGMLAGTSEGGGDIIEVDGRRMIEFYGMSSATAQRKHGGVKSYRASEGRTTLIPYKGTIDDVMQNILGCLNSTCSYTNSHTIDALKFAEFERVNSVLNKSLAAYTTGI